jgi:protein-S-isoprenylcysteine O-methyltransferase Ste14
LGNYALFGAIDGWFACYLPHHVVNSIEWSNGIVFLFLLAVATYGLRLRISEEELMLKENFGQEWEEWHAKTARFIPGVW